MSEKNPETADEMEAAYLDAATTGTGFLLIRPGGVERIDPARVFIQPKDKKDPSLR